MESSWFLLWRIGRIGLDYEPYFTVVLAGSAWLFLGASDTSYHESEPQNPDQFDISVARWRWLLAFLLVAIKKFARDLLSFGIVSNFSFIGFVWISNNIARDSQEEGTSHYWGWPRQITDAWINNNAYELFK